ncbi:fungal hydrophobin domain-containing protein [Trichoderma evansii]
MQFTTIVALFASLAMAAPATEVANAADTADAAQAGPCSSGLTNSTPQCCGAGLLGVLHLDCQTPRQVSSVLNPLSSVCALKGLQAKCCTVGIAGLGLLCQDALPE